MKWDLLTQDRCPKCESKLIREYNGSRCLDCDFFITHKKMVEIAPKKLTTSEDRKDFLNEMEGYGGEEKIGIVIDDGTFDDGIGLCRKKKCEYPRPIEESDKKEGNV